MLIEAFYPKQQVWTHIIWRNYMPDLLQPSANLWRRTKRTLKDKDGHESCQGCGIEDLQTAGENIKPTFDLIYDMLAVKTGCVTTNIPVMKKSVDAEGNYITAGSVKGGRIIMHKSEAPASSKAPNKKAKRIEQKCFTKYKIKSKEAGENPVRYINDVVRCTMAFNDVAAMHRALLLIVRCQRTRVEHAEDGRKSGSYVIVRLKQIYEPRSSLVYGDIKVNLLVTNADLPNGHNCELQLNTVAFLIGKGTPAGHGAYEAWRDLDDEHWKQFGRGLPNNIADFPGDFSRIHGKGVRAIHNSHVAYRAGAMDFDRSEAGDGLLKLVEKLQKENNWR